MASKRRQWVIGLSALVVVQLAVVLIYMSKRSASRSRLGSFGSEVLAPRPAPPLTFARHDGSKATLAEMRGKVVMVHFWATWCAPCRKELPGLLALATTLEATGGFELLAASVEDDWDEMKQFFGSTIPRSAVRPDEAEVHRRFGASTLPDSYLVDASGNLVRRYAGARDWTSAAAKEDLESSIEMNRRAR